MPVHRFQSVARLECFFFAPRVVRQNDPSTQTEDSVVKQQRFYAHRRLRSVREVLSSLGEVRVDLSHFGSVRPAAVRALIPIGYEII